MRKQCYFYVVNILFVREKVFIDYWYFSACSVVRYSICGEHNKNIPYYLYWISQGIWQVIGIVWTKSVSLCSLQRLHNYKMDMEFRGAASPYITVNIRRTTVCRTIFHLNLKVNSYSLTLTHTHYISDYVCLSGERKDFLVGRNLKLIPLETTSIRQLLSKWD